MAETSSPCLVRSFSQPSSKSCDGHEGDLLRALSSSISFGRYMSDSLAWEKWSAFTHNKYREEAERYSRPGSVAEKKAFFEARYKKIAAKKSADSVEQQSAAGDDHSSDMSRVSQNYGDGSMGSESAGNAKHLSTEKMQGEEMSNADGCYPETAMSKKSTEQPIFSKNEKMDTKGTVTMGDSCETTAHSSKTVKPSTIKSGLPKPPPVKPPSIQSKKTEHSTTPSSSSKRSTKGSAIKNQSAPRSLHVSINFERDEPTKMSSPILQKIVNSKFVRAITNSIQESRSQKSPIAESGISLSKNVTTSEPDVHVCMDSVSAENANHVDTEEMQGGEFPNAVSKQTEQPTFSNNQVEPLKQKEVDRGIDKNKSHLDEKMDTLGTVTMGDSLVSDETTHSSTTTKPSTKSGFKQPSIQSKKTEHSTPSRSMHTTKGSAIKSQSGPLSLHVSDNFEHDEPVKPSSPILQRIVNSKFVRAITNTTRESRSQKTPIRASSYSLSKHVTSEPESRRTITLPDRSLSRSRIMEVQSQASCTSNSKSPTARGSKTQPSIACSSFVFRSEERAIKRKEFYQKLEQKLKEEQQLQQTKAMSKRTSEPTVFSACTSKANHHTRDSSSNPMKKMPETQPCSPKLGKKPISRVQENGSRPPWRLPGKSDSLKDAMGKTNKPFVHSGKLFLKESRHENASPNIQL